MNSAICSTDFTKFKVERYSEDRPYYPPIRKTMGAAGHDVYSLDEIIFPDCKETQIDVRTNLVINFIPIGYYLKVAGRSGLFYKYGIRAEFIHITHDSENVGKEILIRLTRSSSIPGEVRMDVKSRIAQMIFGVEINPIYQKITMNITARNTTEVSPGIYAVDTGRKFLMQKPCNYIQVLPGLNKDQCPSFFKGIIDSDYKDSVKLLIEKDRLKFSDIMFYLNHLDLEDTIVMDKGEDVVRGVYGFGSTGIK